MQDGGPPPSSTSREGDESTPPRETGERETEEAAKLRFEAELEFVQCLANVGYLNYLALNRYFDDKAFVRYLNYLLYWKRPEYARYIAYPHCLFFLSMLQEETFRKQLVNADFVSYLHQQQHLHWRFYRHNRLAQENAPEPLPHTPSL